MVTAELGPQARATAVGDSIAALAKALRQLGHTVSVALPRYPSHENSGLLLARRLSPLVLEPGLEVVGEINGRLDIALLWFVGATRYGKAMRATAQDPDAARLMGIDVDRTISLTFVMGAALAAVAGLMATLYYGVIDFFIGFLAGVKAFTAAVLGGIGSLPGAMLGGLLIGLIEAFWSAYFSIEYKDVATFTILVLVLIFRPTGLLGKPEIEKV